MLKKEPMMISPFKYYFCYLETSKTYSIDSKIEVDYQGGSQINGH